MLRGGIIGNWNNNVTSFIESRIFLAEPFIPEIYIDHLGAPLLLSEFSKYLESVNIIFFESVSSSNIKLLEATIKSSVPVFIKGFLNISVKESERIYKLSCEARSPVIISSYLTQYPIFSGLHELLVEPIYLNIVYKNSLHSSSLIQSLLGLVCSLIKSEVRSLEFHEHKILSEHIDLVKINIAFREGKFAEITIDDTLKRKEEFTIQLFQSESVIIVHPIENQAEIQDSSGKKILQALSKEEYLKSELEKFILNVEIAENDQNDLELILQPFFLWRDIKKKSTLFKKNF